jgi:ABC-type tungstate transport system substrate-binding protein
MTRILFSLFCLLVALLVTGGGVWCLLCLSGPLGLLLTLVGMVLIGMTCRLLQLAVQIARLEDELSHMDDGFREFVRLLEERK